MQILEQYKSARRVGTPLMAISTMDPASTIHSIVSNTHEAIPVIMWDICSGWRPLNKSGLSAIEQTLKIKSFKDEQDVVAERTQDPASCLISAIGLPNKAILIMMNAQMHLPSTLNPAAVFVQALWNLRDLFKTNKRSVVMMGVSFTIPPELTQDVLLLDEELPSESEIKTIVTEVIESAKSGKWLSDGVTPYEVDKAVDALRGLSAFAAEQITSMSCKELKLDLDMLWERKRKIIEATPGLSVWREGQRFKDIGGIDAGKEFFTKVINGRRSPRCIVFLDEIEKAMAGAAGDLSGVSQDQLGVMLTSMQDNHWTGSILYGQPGAAKTTLAKAIGNEAGVPTIYFDLGAMTGSLMGESQHKIRDVMKIIKAIGGDRVLFLATCNDIRPLKPELRSRFGLPTFFFDLPDAASDYEDRHERDTIWDIYLEKFGFPIRMNSADTAGLIGIDDRTWTGREIERCVAMAHELQIPLEDAAKYIIPIATSSSEEVQERRRLANGVFLSASTPGKFTLARSGDELTNLKKSRGAFGELN
jgi:hypothetical protein